MVGIPVSCAIHVHFQGPGHRHACLSTARCPPVSPPSPVCRSIQGSPQGRQDLHHRGPQRCEDGLHWPPEAGVRPLLTKNPLHHRSLLPASRLALDGGYAFQITWWCSRLSGGGGGGTAGLAHPRSQDSLLPTCHLLINTDRFASEVATGKVQSVCACVTRSECSKRAAGNIHVQCERREVVLTCECVL